MDRATTRLINDEVKRQDAVWGDQAAIGDDRWMQVVERDMHDLMWAVRTKQEIEEHTIQDETIQLIAVLCRWLTAGVVANDGLNDDEA